MSTTERRTIIVIGGTAAGPTAAARARRLDEQAEIIILQKGKDLSMASCGYPYYVGGVFDDRNLLLATPTGTTRDPLFYLNAKGITARTETEALAIDPVHHTVRCRNLVNNTEEELHYDKLIIATGSKPRLPDLPGLDLEGVTTLQSMRDADYLRRVRDERRLKKAVIVGGGLIGIETAEALHLAGIGITIIEAGAHILPFLDDELAMLVENHIRAKGANLLCGNAVSAFLGSDGKLTAVKLANGTELDCELAVIAIGVVPNSELAAAAGLRISEIGAIAVDEFLQTSAPDIYAAGDCIAVPHMLTGKMTYAPYGDLANLEGRVAADNAVLGNRTVFPGTIQTGICKVFEFTAGTTGLNERLAGKYGLPPYLTAVNAGLDKPGFMGGKLLVSKMLADRDTGRLLGYQCVGTGDVSKQIALAAMAIRGHLSLTSLATADLPYAPPFSPAIDHFITSAHVLSNKRDGRMAGISAVQLKELLDRDEPLCLIDVRSTEEFEAMRLGRGEILIPLGALRRKLSELPQDRDTPIICFCKISLRGYEAATVLRAHGWRNVRVLEGGLMAWPYRREK